MPRSRLLLDYATDHAEAEVPDIFRRGPEGFKLNVELIEASGELLKDIRKRHLYRRG